MTLTAVSLFAGVEGFGLAAQRAGINVVAAVEIDNSARGVIADRMPHIQLFTDIRKVTPDELLAAGFVPDRGLLAGGFPCQDVSVAGRRAGLGGARTGLFWEIVRLADALRPRWLLLENVPGLLSSNDGRDMGTVLGALGDLGYGFAYRVLDAQFFGVPQRRHRVFIVASAGGDTAGPAQVLLEPESRDGDPAAGVEAGPGVAATLTGGAHSAGVSAPGRRAEDDINLVPLTSVVSTIQGGGLAATGSTLKAQQAVTSSSCRQVVNALTSNGVGAVGADDNQAQAGHLIPTGGGRCFQKVTRPATSDHPDVWEERDVAATLSGFDLVRRLTPRECERLQGFPDDWTLTSNGREQSDSARYRQMGNAVAVPVGEWILRRLVGVDALTCEDAS